MKKIDLVDQNMIRAMAKEAEAFRDRKAAIIRAEGEFEVCCSFTSFHLTAVTSTLPSPPLPLH